MGRREGKKGERGEEKRVNRIVSSLGEARHTEATDSASAPQ